jgi:ferredoxin-NADP reductase
MWFACRCTGGVGLWHRRILSINIQVRFSPPTCAYALVTNPLSLRLVHLVLQVYSSNSLALVGHLRQLSAPSPPDPILSPPLCSPNLPCLVLICQVPYPGLVFSPPHYLSPLYTQRGVRQSIIPLNCHRHRDHMDHIPLCLVHQHRRTPQAVVVQPPLLPRRHGCHRSCRIPLPGRFSSSLFQLHPFQAQQKPAMDPERFLDLKLKSIEPYNYNTSRFTFELPDGGVALSPVAPLVVVRASEGSSRGQGVPVDKKGELAVRAYTPISSLDREGELVLLIKKYENGVVSKYVHEWLKPNDTLAIKGPIVKIPYKGTFALPSISNFKFYLFFSLVANEFENVALIGGGSGITPLYQLLNHTLADPTNRTQFTLLYAKLLCANVSKADILLRDELAALQRAHPQTFKVVHMLDKSPRCKY